MRSRNRKESNIQVDDVDEDETGYNFMLLKTASILSGFNSLLGKIFSSPASSQEDQYYETIRSSRKSFTLNDPATFHEDLTQHRPFVPARAVLPLCHKGPETTGRRFIIKEDEEEELYCVLHAEKEKEEIVKVYTSDSKGRQEIMKVYVDNEPPKRIVSRKDSVWKFIPKSRKKENKVIKTQKPNCHIKNVAFLLRELISPEMVASYGILIIL